MPIEFLVRAKGNRVYKNTKSRVISGDLMFALQGYPRQRNYFQAWCGRRESNPRLKLGKLSFYHYTTPAGVWYSIRVWYKSPDKKTRHFGAYVICFHQLGFATVALGISGLGFQYYCVRQ